MSHIMPGTPGDTNPTRMYTVTEAAEILLNRLGLNHRFTVDAARTALRSCELLSVLRNGRLYVSDGVLSREETLTAFQAQLLPAGKNARAELFRRVAGAFIDESKANALLDAHRAEVLAEAIEAARGEYLTDGTGTDAVAAIGRLTEGGADRAAEIRTQVLSEVADLLMQKNETAAALLVDRLREAGESRG